MVFDQTQAFGENGSIYPEALTGVMVVTKACGMYSKDEEELRVVVQEGIQDSSPENALDHCLCFLFRSLAPRGDPVLARLLIATRSQVD